MSGVVCVVCPFADDEKLKNSPDYAMTSSCNLLQCVAICCSVLQCVGMFLFYVLRIDVWCSVE